MEDAKELILDDLDQEAEARKKLDALLEQGKKAGKVSSKQLIETLDAVDAESALSAMETERAFLLGLQLGLSLGRLSLLPNE